MKLDQCPLLMTLKGTSNALIQLPNLFNAILLNQIDLSSNSLTSLDELSMGSWLPFLTHLRLSSNNIQDLPLIKLPSLLELNLSFNQLIGKNLIHMNLLFILIRKYFYCRFVFVETLYKSLSIIKFYEYRTQSGFM